MTEQDKDKSKIPTSPDSLKWLPAQVAPGAPSMGGPQTGGIATTPSKEPKPEWTPSPPDSMIRRQTRNARANK
jgi:hypothetical protein